MDTKHTVISRAFSHNALCRKKFIRIAWTALAFTLALSCSFLAALPLAAKEYFVTASALNVRATPSLTAEIVNLLPPGVYDRQALCDQLNSALAAHGWGAVYGTVE